MSNLLFDTDPAFALQGFFPFSSIQIGEFSPISSLTK